MSAQCQVDLVPAAIAWPPRRAAGRAVGLIAQSLLIASCGPVDRPAGDDVAARDSAGVRIAQHTWAQIQALPQRRVDDQPAVHLGAAVDASGPYVFSGIVGAARLRDGTLVVADAGSGELRAFSGLGEHLGTWGREGEGPGEFTGFWGMGRLPGDSLVVWDLGLSRLSVFGPQGRVGRIATIMGAGSRSLVGVLESGVLLALIPTSDISDLSREGYQDVTHRHEIRDWEGSVMAMLRPHTLRRRYGVRRDRSMVVADIPFSSRVVAAVWGELAVVAPNERYDILGYGEDGSLKRIIRVERPPRRVGANDVEAYWRDRDSRRGQPSRTERTLRQEIPPSAFMPAFSSIVGDGTGQLWVQDMHVPGSEWQYWTVFDAAGSGVSRIQVPGGLNVLDVGQDHVLGTMTGEMGVQSVALFRILPS